MLARPALHVGRHQQVLPQLRSLQRKRRDVGVAEVELSHRAHHQIYRRLHQAAAVRFSPESIRQQQLFDSRGNVISTAAKALRNAVDLRAVGHRRDEFFPELADDEAGGFGLLEQNIQCRIAVKIAAATQYGFVAVIMESGPKLEAEIVTLDAPAGEGARRFPDVLFGVESALAGLAQGKQLHHLARKILVGRFLAAVGAVQVHQHGRVFGHRMKKVTKIAKRLCAQQLVLPPHCLRTAHLLLRS